MVICNGPLALTFPANQCGAPDLPSVNVKNIVNAVPEQLRKVIQDLELVNGMIAKAIDYQGLKDLKVTVDRTLVEAFDLSFDKSADAIWLAGCWPPQRYAVVSGMVHIPAGQMHIEAAGLDLVVTFRDRRVPAAADSARARPCGRLSRSRRAELQAEGRDRVPEPPLAFASACPLRARISRGLAEHSKHRF